MGEKVAQALAELTDAGLLRQLEPQEVGGAAATARAKKRSAPRSSGRETTFLKKVRLSEVSGKGDAKAECERLRVGVQEFL